MERFLASVCRESVFTQNYLCQGHLLDCGLSVNIYVYLRSVNKLHVGLSRALCPPVKCPWEGTPRDVCRGPCAASLLRPLSEAQARRVGPWLRFPNNFHLIVTQAFPSGVCSAACASVIL